jgi:hypothetical protein
MEKYVKHIKGQKGVSRKYKVLGETKQMKVPSLVYDKIKYILQLLDEYGKVKDMDMVYKLLDGMITVLETNCKN